MSKFNTQVLNRAVSIHKLSQNNVKQFNHVHLTLDQFKSLYMNSKKISKLSSDLVELERYLVSYNQGVKTAQKYESDNERINKASLAADKPKISEKDKSHKSATNKSTAKAPAQTRVAKKHFAPQPKSWKTRLIQRIRRDWKGTIFAAITDMFTKHPAKENHTDDKARHSSVNKITKK